MRRVRSNRAGKAVADLPSRAARIPRRTVAAHPLAVAEIRIRTQPTARACHPTLRSALFNANRRRFICVPGCADASGRAVNHAHLPRPQQFGDCREPLGFARLKRDHHLHGARTLHRRTFPRQLHQRFRLPHPLVVRQDRRRGGRPRACRTGFLARAAAIPTADRIPLFVHQHHAERTGRQRVLARSEQVPPQMRFPADLAPRCTCAGPSNRPGPRSATAAAAPRSRINLRGGGFLFVRSTAPRGIIPASINKTARLPPLLAGL